MTNQEAIRLLELSRKELSDVPGFSLNKAIVEAEMKLEVIKKTFEKMVKVSESLQEKQKEYNKEMEDINLKYCLRDDEGKPVIVEEPLGNGQVLSRYEFSNENRVKRAQAVAELDKKFKSTIDAFVEINKKRNELLEEESGYKPPEIDEKMVSEAYKKMAKKESFTEKMRVLYRMFKIK